MKKTVLSVLLCLAVMLSACTNTEDQQILNARATSRADLMQFPGLIREPLPVNFILPDGATVVLDGLVTRPDRSGRFPLVLINHGMSSSWDDRKDETPNQMTDAALYFAQRGWAAVTVVRPGYGKSGGPYLEGLGPCNARDFHALADRMAGEVLSILKVVSDEPWVDRSGILLFGQSGGGFAVLAAAAANPSNVVGVINFSGGAGSPTKGSFCQPERLVAEMGKLGKTARIPSLWVYSENDSYTPPKLARAMYSAYRDGEAPATFFAAPSYQDEGHYFIDAVSQWSSQVDSFMTSLHLSTKVKIELPTPSKPLPSPDGGESDAFFKEYLALPYYEKAYAAGDNGIGGYVTGYPTIGAAKLRAMQICQARGPGCHVYAIGNQLAPH